MKLSKGVELPMNTLVVVAIAIIVLLGMTALFIGGFGPTSQNLQAKNDFQNWCNRWVQVNCDPDDDYLIRKVFESYNKWQQRYYNQEGEKKTLCTDLNDCSDIRQRNINTEDIIKELQSACSCWFIAPTTPETGTTPGEGQQQQ